MKNGLLKQVKSILSFATDRAADRRVCVGDFFDTYKNDQGDVLAALPAFMQTDIILAGNHDLLAHASSVSSLVFLDQLCKQLPLDATEQRPLVIYGELGKPCVQEVALAEENPGIGGGYKSRAKMFFVPHVYTQELFEKSLKGLLAELKVATAAGWKCYVFLHCNIDSGFAENSDIALNLTTESAKALLAAGALRIICGHEHEPRDLLQGRLIVLGNTYPTSFGDISHKRVMTLDTATDEVFFDTCYEAQDHYANVDWQQCDVTQNWPLPQTCDVSAPHWIRLTGTAMASQVVEVAKLIKKLWEACPDLYGIKMDVKIAEMNLDASGGTISVADLKAIITKELQSQPDLLALWNEVAQ